MFLGSYNVTQLFTFANFNAEITTINAQLFDHNLLGGWDRVGLSAIFYLNLAEGTDVRIFLTLDEDSSFTLLQSGYLTTTCYFDIFAFLFKDKGGFYALGFCRWYDDLCLTNLHYQLFLIKLDSCRHL